MLTGNPEHARSLGGVYDVVKDHILGRLGAWHPFISGFLLPTPVVASAIHLHRFQ
ncbi:MAG: hypothetical protein M3R02_28405 [Chloroflexota bacterium]|nr:hypothetical protein [Chloroflexota bacterium]